MNSSFPIQCINILYYYSASAAKVRRHLFLHLVKRSPPQEAEPSKEFHELPWYQPHAKVSGLFITSWHRERSILWCHVFKYWVHVMMNILRVFRFITPCFICFSSLGTIPSSCMLRTHSHKKPSINTFGLQKSRKSLDVISHHQKWKEFRFKSQTV